MIQNFFKKQKRFLLFSLLLLCTFSGYILYGILSLPDSIYLTVGQEAEVKLNLPVDVNLLPETMPVSNMYDEANRDKVTSGEKLPINTDETGKTSMELSFLGVPVKKVSVEVLPEIELVPCGKTVEVEINTQGPTVLGTGSVTTSDGQTQNPSEGVFNSGDILLKANGLNLDSTKTLEDILQKTDKNLDITVKRNDKTFDVSLSPVKDEKGENKLGLWLRDGTKGIGTITYYNPVTRSFGALGHGITDVDTKKLISVKTGLISDTAITSIRKGKKGSPGELVGSANSAVKLGNIVANTALGLYGFVNDNNVLPPMENAVKIALQNEAHTGPAVIMSNVDGTEVKEYDIYIESINKMSSDESKGLIIRITDQELLSKTNGIVQGMSGSPILQNGKLIGAVTHVFVQNPAKGYGIFIENMLKQEEKIKS